MIFEDRKEEGRKESYFLHCNLMCPLFQGNWNDDLEPQLNFSHFSNQDKVDGNEAEIIINNN